MLQSTKSRPSLAILSVKWLLLSLAFVWLVGCVAPNTRTKGRDPFAEGKFKCGEEMPPGHLSKSKG